MTTSFLLPPYAELQCCSNFTFLRGASHAEELVARAAALDYAALAITDECSLAGVVRAHVAAQEAKLPLLIGSFFRLVNADGTNGPELTILAQNRNGYGNLCELITLARTRVEKGAYLIQCDDFDRPAAAYQHLRWMPDCLVILALPTTLLVDAHAFDAQARWASRTFFKRLWLGLSLHGGPDDEWLRETAERAAARYQLPTVALGGVCMHVRSRKPLQDTLSATRLRKSVAECGYDLDPNAERDLRGRLRLANLYPTAMLAETLTVAEQCTFSLDEL